MGFSRKNAKSRTKLQDGSLSERLAAVSEIAERGGSDALDLLGFALLDDRREVRKAAVIALGKTGNPDAADLLNVVLYDVSKDVRKAAATALGKVGGPGAERLLHMAKGDADDDVRNTVARALRRIERSWTADAPSSDYPTARTSTSAAQKTKNAGSSTPLIFLLIVLAITPFVIPRVVSAFHGSPVSGHIPVMVLCLLWALRIGGIWMALYAFSDDVWYLNAVGIGLAAIAQDALYPNLTSIVPKWSVAGAIGACAVLSLLTSRLEKRLPDDAEGAAMLARVSLAVAATAFLCGMAGRLPGILLATGAAVVVGGHPLNQADRGAAKALVLGLLIFATGVSLWIWHDLVAEQFTRPNLWRALVGGGASAVTVLILGFILSLIGPKVHGHLTTSVTGNFTPADYRYQRASEDTYWGTTAARDQWESRWHYNEVICAVWTLFLMSIGVVVLSGLLLLAPCLAGVIGFDIH